MLKTLAEAIGISGAEKEVRKLIVEAIADHVDEWRVDAMGNILALKRGTGESPLKGLIAAHMDEVGFMVVGHDSNGMLQVRNVGGIDDKLLPSLRVVVGNERLPGVFVWKPIHMGNSQSIVSIKDMRVDIGASSKDAAAGVAPVGSRVAFASEYVELSETTVRCKAFDDRAGCAEAIELLQGDPFPFDLHVAFTVQEEVGLRGAQVLAEAIQPDFAVILECTACHEVPQDDDLPDQTTVTKMGHGPAIYHMDRTTITPPKLVNHFVSTAEELNIPHQFRSAQFAGGTDAGAIHKGASGVPSISIALPGRYIHSPYSMISLNDYRNAIELVRAGLTRMTPSVLEQ